MNPRRRDSCRNSGPLPGRFYEIWRLERECSVCGKAPRLTVKKRGPGRAWKLCLNDDCPTMVEMREKRAEREAAKAAKEAAKAMDSDGAEANGDGSRQPRGARRRRDQAEAIGRRAATPAEGAGADDRQDEARSQQYSAPALTAVSR